MPFRGALRKLNRCAIIFLSFTFGSNSIAQEIALNNWETTNKTKFSSPAECDAKLLSMINEDIHSQKVTLKAKRKNETKLITEPGNLVVTKLEKNSSGLYERFMCEKQTLLILTSEHN